MAEFLRIDGDLLHVAAQASPPKEDTNINRDEVRSWVATLPAGEKDELVTNLMVNADHAQIAELLQRFLKERTGNALPATERRTVGQLLRAAATYATKRKRIEAERRTKEKVQREREAAYARQEHLDSLVGSEARLWTEVDSLVATRQPKKYDEAVLILVDLRDLADRSKGGSDFSLRIEALRKTQEKKPSFTEKLQKAGLWK